MSAGRALLRLPLEDRHCLQPLRRAQLRASPTLVGNFAKGTFSVGRVSAFHAAALSVILLSGCKTFIPPPPQIISVPIAASCLPTTLPQRPKIATDVELSAMDDYKFTLEIFIDRRRLLDYSGELEAVLLACK